MNNKNDLFENEQIYARLNIDICTTLLDEYYDIYNIEAFDLYVWGYFCLNGFLDSSN